MGIPKNANLLKVATATLALIIVLLPFHAFLSIWAASLIGHYGVVRLWKEILLLLLIPVAIVLLWRRPKLWQELDTRWLFWASIAYAALTCGLGILAVLQGEASKMAVGYALVINLRFLLIFWLALIVAAQSPWLKLHWRKLVLIPAAFVVVFGLMQYFILPVDFMRHFGYGPGTIMPFETVDQKAAYVRVQSFLRGANPLGAYLILVLAACASLLAPWRGRRQQGRAALLFLWSLIVLLATFSRSAYIGAAATLALLGWWALRQKLSRKVLITGTVSFLFVISGVLLVMRDNDHFQNVVFHTDEHSLSRESSNESRTAALSRGVHDVATEPFGRGPGTAGPASAHNVVAPARISEDYYLQIGQETGWLGLGLFMTILVLVAAKLWQQRRHALARVLLASFLGLSLVNLISHAWTDDTIALLWWALAGICLAPAILPLPEKPKAPHVVLSGPPSPKL